MPWCNLISQHINTQAQCSACQAQELQVAGLLTPPKPEESHWECRRGQVLLATVNEQTMVPFVSQQLNNLDLALSLAKRGNLPGAEALVGQNFERLFANGQYKEAAEAAAESPQV